MRMRLCAVIVACQIAGLWLPGSARAAVNFQFSAGLQIGSPSDFYQPLDAYGEWITLPSYGRCWHPVDVVQDWRPYSVGYWEWTDCGWYWVSDEPWAWACYHYGGWEFDPTYGWVWIPGTEWAPAWVTWREGPDYIGWAPCGPGGVSLGASFFAFVDIHHFHDHLRPRDFIVHNTRIIDRTRLISNNHVRERRSIGGRQEQVIVNRGPSIQTIQKVTGRSFKARPLTQVVEQTPVPASVQRNPNTNIRHRTLKAQPSRRQNQQRNQGTATPMRNEQNRQNLQNQNQTPPTGRNQQRNYQQNQQNQQNQQLQQQRQNRENQRNRNNNNVENANPQVSPNQSQPKPATRPGQVTPTGRENQHPSNPNRTYEAPSGTPPTPATPPSEAIPGAQPQKAQPPTPAPPHNVPPTGRELQQQRNYEQPTPSQPHEQTPKAKIPEAQPPREQPDNVPPTGRQVPRNYERPMPSSHEQSLQPPSRGAERHNEVKPSLPSSVPETPVPPTGRGEVERHYEAPKPQSAPKMEQPRQAQSPAQIQSPRGQGHDGRKDRDDH